jgi:ubiquitin-protein ligase
MDGEKDSQQEYQELVQTYIKELRETDSVPRFSLFPHDTDPSNWFITFQGPEASPYCEQILILRLFFPGWKIQSEFKAKGPKFIFYFYGNLPLHPRFYAQPEILLLPRPEDTPKLVLLQIRKILTLPLAAPWSTLLQLYRQSPEKYFMEVAASSGFSQLLTRDHVAAWKRPQEISDYKYRLRVFLPNLSFIFSSLDLTWSPGTHKLFLCPIWREIVFTCLTANKYYYGKNLLGVPIPLLYEILVMVARDFFEKKNWINFYSDEESLEIPKTDWISDSYQKLGDYRILSRPAELVQVLIRTLDQKRYTYKIHPQETILEIIYKFTRDQEHSCPERCYFIRAGKFCDRNDSLESFTAATHLNFFVLIDKRSDAQKFWFEDTCKYDMK